VDRLPARVGNENPSKPYVILECERENPKRPGHFLPGRWVRKQHKHETKWTDKKSVRELNAWREQVYRRDLDEARSTRHFVSNHWLAWCLSMCESFCLTPVFYSGLSEKETHSCVSPEA
jgi:hypothetical protein